MLLVSPRESVVGQTLPGADETHFWRVARHDELDCFTATFRKHVFPPHTHETYVIGAIVSGIHRYSHCGSLIRSGPGHLCFINPGEVHDGAPDRDGYSYRMIYPQPSLLEAILRETTGRTEGPPRFHAPSVKDEELAQGFIALHKALEDGHDRLRADEMLIGFLLAAIARYGGGLRNLISDGKEPEAVKKAKSYLLAHVGETVDLAALSAHVGLSAWHLIRVFRKATGLTPHAWLIDRRVHLARQLLRAGEPLVQAASVCGFADQSHLTRVFKARLGVTPGQYCRLVA
jgi:AraC-like DNA-binding protein